ncbi:hypothetical protein AAG906_000606 [Vitis piasezkii]
MKKPFCAPYLWTFDVKFKGIFVWPLSIGKGVLFTTYLLMRGQLESNPPFAMLLRTFAQQMESRQASSLHKGCLDKCVMMPLLVVSTCWRYGAMCDSPLTWTGWVEDVARSGGGAYMVRIGRLGTYGLYPGRIEDMRHVVPFFSQMDDQLLDAICERLVSSLSTQDAYIVREGDPVNEMLFIIRGQLESSTANGGQSSFFNSITQAW